MRLAMIFWKTCPDQIGAALIANLMFKSMARHAELTEKLQLAEDLIANARFVSSLVGFRHPWNAVVEQTCRFDSL